MSFPKWFEKNGVKKLFSEEPKEIGWEPCSGHYNFARGQWIEDAPAHKQTVKKLVAAEGKEELAGLRAEYKRRFDKRPFNGWDAATLREKLG